MPRRRLLPSACAQLRRLLSTLAALTLGSTALHAAVDFSRDIAPLLSDNCFHCHGPDEKGRKAKLRLDTAAGAFKPNKEGVAAIVPGDSAHSDAITRIFSDDPDEIMPPPKSDRKLSADQKALLKRWVDEGAKWGAHWAFTQPKRPAQPGAAEFDAALAGLALRDPKQAAALQQNKARWTTSNPIDSFVLNRLLSEGLEPAPEAGAATLCRRLHLDLNGLPPTVAEVDAFVAASKLNPQNALNELVDRLLASPRYGERMIWEWLEAARYADTNGFQGDPTRPMWFWRDWAIKALNANMPFDQFTIEQLAGDLLPAPTQEQLVATGFHRNHMLNGEGGRIPEETRIENVQDRVETTGTVWLGLTFNCCRCHDHKFDPVSQRDYYQIAAYFNSIDETGDKGPGGLAKPVLDLATPEQAQKVADEKAKAQEVEKELRDMEAKLRAEVPTWAQELRADPARLNNPEPVWQLLEPSEAFSDNGTILTQTPDGALVASGPSPATDSYVITAKSGLKEVTAFKLEALPDPAFANQGPGRADNGNFVLSEMSILSGGRPLKLDPIRADVEQTGFAAAKAFDGDANTGWAILPGFGKPHSLVFEPRTNVSPDDKLLSFRLSFQFGHRHTLGRFKLYATTDNRALLRPMPEPIRALLLKAAESRTEAETEELAKYYLAIDPRLAAIKKRRDQAGKELETIQAALPRTMVMRDKAKPRDTFILVKGAYDKPADPVSVGTPAALPALPADAPKNRLALARWLVAPEHPLTARVTVNRYWQMFFGCGLVKTSDDFGLQGEKPSHPELLDWLAREFVDSGWDVKHLHKLIVTSATYRQSSKFQPGMAERDPENRLLARGPRFRMPSWMLRDQALALSGLLVEQQGGPAAKVYQPTGLWEDATFGQIKFQQDHGEALYRRSLYVFWRRIVGPPVFFDVANRQTCSVRVYRTNTPLQALTTLNDVTYVEAARALAERTLKETAGDDATRVAAVFQRCVLRPPTTSERELIVARLGTLRATYRADTEAAKRLIATGESKPDPTLAPVELAAWTGVCSLLLNLDETLTKE